jgi:hypothetical protein
MIQFQPKLGESVRVLVPGSWERRAVVLEVDCHPSPLESSAVRVRFVGEVAADEEWVDARHVFPETK